MNAPVLHRSLLKHHVAAIEATHPIKIIGLLPHGSAGHVFEDDAIEFLAERRNGLSYFGLAKAERDLGHLLGHRVGIVLLSELSGREAEELPNQAEPL